MLPLWRRQVMDRGLRVIIRRVVVRHWLLLLRLTVVRRPWLLCWRRLMRMVLWMVLRIVLRSLRRLVLRMWQWRLRLRRLLSVRPRWCVRHVVVRRAERAAALASRNPARCAERPDAFAVSRFESDSPVIDSLTSWENIAGYCGRMSCEGELDCYMLGDCGESRSPVLSRMYMYMYMYMYM